MYKFFVPSTQVSNDRIEILGEDVNHIKNVLRFEVGQEILVGNVDTMENYVVKIEKMNQDKIIGIVLEKKDKSTESKIHVHIFQGLPKQEKMEMIIQKATELGVNEITPLKMERCIVKLEEKQESKKIERWQKIAEVAAKQSKRDKIPHINYSTNLKNLYKNVEEYDIVILAYEEEQNAHLKQVLRDIKQHENLKIAIIVGPEGGISRQEVEQLEMLPNLKTISLGNRILRTETAPIVLASILMYEFDEME